MGKMKNLIPIIRKEFGLEVNEEFYINSYSLVYQFTEDDIKLKHRNLEQKAKENLIYSIVTGRVKIIKLPYQPEDGDSYWTYSSDYWYVKKREWWSNPINYFHKNCKCVFRTKEEAENMRPQRYRELTGKDMPKEWIEQ